MKPLKHGVWFSVLWTHACLFLKPHWMEIRAEIMNQKCLCVGSRSSEERKVSPGGLWWCRYSAQRFGVLLVFIYLLLFFFIDIRSLACVVDRFVLPSSSSSSSSSSWWLMSSSTSSPDLCLLQHCQPQRAARCSWRSRAPSGKSGELT